MININPIDNVNNTIFRQMIFAYWNELMPKAQVLQTQEKREEYFKSEFASGVVFGAWADVKLVGYIHLQVNDDVGSLDGIYIIPEARRQGNGTRLMNWAFAYFDQLGIGQIDIYVRRDNPKAKAFYEALGFGVAGYRMRLYRENGQILPGVLSSDL